jgi:1,2-diacylglycerol 3-alpha-glucosyltransferase
MKIGFFTDSYKPYVSGVVKSIELFSEQLKKEGHEVYIFAPDYPGVKLKENIFRFKSIPAITSPEFRLAIPFSLKIMQSVRSLNIDIIHTHSPFLMGWLARYIAKRLNIPLVFTYHTLYEKYIHYVPVGHELARKLTVKYCKEFCQTCDLLITPTDYVQKILESYNINTPIKTVSTGIDLLPYYKRNGLSIRGKYGIRDDEKVLLFVGRLGQEKNVEFLLKSFKLVVDSLANTRLIMVGDGPQKKKLMKMKDDLFLFDKLIFAGHQEPEMVTEFYLASDLFVFPSITETQGLVTIEAMAGGLPVVAVNAAGSSVMVDDGLNGLLVKEDEHLFAETIIDLLTHDKRYNFFVKNAIKKAEEFSIENMTGRLIKEYEEILSGYNKCGKNLA